MKAGALRMTSLSIGRPAGMFERVSAHPCLRACLRIGLGIAVLASAGAFAAPLQGKVVRVFDGDSVAFQADGGGKPVEIRLKDIDAPEICQAGGTEARDFLQSFVDGKPARLETAGKDVYGRTLAVMTVDEMNVNQRLVAEGHAWSIRTKWNQGPFVSQEKMAQALKRGLHGTPGAVMPSEFRRIKGPCGGGAASAPADAPSVAPSGASRPAAKPARGAAMAPPLAPPVATQVGAAGFRCDGRTQCSQMTSCEEARYFLAQCPGVKMDGNRDGVPCERQWCS
jgi:endonuclease YncB( thermonuclease family)